MPLINIAAEKFTSRFESLFIDLDYYDKPPFEYPRRMQISIMDRIENVLVDFECVTVDSQKDFHKKGMAFFDELWSVME